MKISNWLIYKTDKTNNVQKQVYSKLKTDSLMNIKQSFPEYSATVKVKHFKQLMKVETGCLKNPNEKNKQHYTNEKGIEMQKCLVTFYTMYFVIS